MKTVAIALVIVGLVSAALVAAAQTGKQGLAERGRYEGVAASDRAVWVVDTRTGKVRRCTQEFADQTPTCSAFSAL